LPPLNWGFQDVDEQPLPALDFGFQHSPPMDSVPPLPALIWGFEGVDVLPAAARDVQKGSLPPLRHANLAQHHIIMDLKAQTQAQIQYGHHR